MHRRRASVLALAAALFVLPALAGDLDGVWKGYLTEPRGKHALTLKLRVEGSQVTGTLVGGPPNGGEQPIVNGKLEGDRISFDVNAQGPGGETMVLSYQGKVSGKHIEGTHESPMGALQWDATHE